MPREFWNRFPYQSEETGDQGDASGASGNNVETTEDTKPVEKTYSPEFVKTLRENERKLAREAADLKKQLAEIQAKQEEEAAAKKGDYEALKKQTLEENARIKAEKEKALAEKEQEVANITAKHERRLKRESLKSAFTGVFNSDAIEDLLANETYAKALKIVENESGDLNVIVVDSDGDPRLKVEKGGKTVPFTVDDLAWELAEKKPSLALPRNQASGDGMPARNGRRFKDGVDPSKMSAAERIAYGRSIGQRG